LALGRGTEVGGGMVWSGGTRRTVVVLGHHEGGGWAGWADATARPGWQVWLLGPNGSNVKEVDFFF
jgi:hypothetical protein